VTQERQRKERKVPDYPLLYVEDVRVNVGKLLQPLKVKDLAVKPERYFQTNKEIVK